MLYLFLVGVEMDPKTMLANAKKTSLVAAFGIGVPFALGFGLAHYLYQVHTMLPVTSRPCHAT